MMQADVPPATARSMTAAPMPTTVSRNEHYVTPAQLRVGLYIHLERSWAEHPFAFSSFRIKSEEQIATLRSLGLARIRYSPERSQGAPLPAPAPAPASTPAAPAADISEAYQQSRPALGVQSKHTGSDRQAAHRARMAACEKSLLENARTARAIDQNLRRRPDEVAGEAGRLVGSMAESMLLDVDIVVRLVADRVGNESLYHHPLNVTLLAMMLARELKRPAATLQHVGLGALFHDAALSSESTGPHHGPAGAELVRPLQLPTPALQAIAQHHEQMDGQGAPQRLRGPQIAETARIVAIANEFDELCNPDDPARALTPHEALSTLYGAQRHRFDTHMLMTFVRCIGIYPPGTIVQLSNHSIATVVAVSALRPLRPTVRLHDVAVPEAHAEIVELEEHRDLSITGTVRPQDLQSALRERIAPRQRLTYHFTTEAQVR